MVWCVAPKYFPFSISTIYDEYGKGEIWQLRDGYDFFSPSFVGDMIHIGTEDFLRMQILARYQQDRRSFLAFFAMEMALDT